MSVEFVIATIQDVPYITKVYNATVPSHMIAADLDPITISEQEKWFKEHSPNRRPVWVMKVNKENAGWVSLSNFDSRAAYNNTAEISIYIDENHRGQGLGTKALDFIAKEAKHVNVTSVMAMIYGHNLPSQKLFKKVGYEQWGKLPRIAKMDNQRYDLLVYGKNFEE